MFDPLPHPIRKNLRAKEQPFSQPPPASGVRCYATLTNAVVLHGNPLLQLEAVGVVGVVGVVDEARPKVVKAPHRHYFKRCVFVCMCVRVCGSH